MKDITRRKVINAMATGGVGFALPNLAGAKETLANGDNAMLRMQQQMKDATQMARL
jgi:hypothetical protein